MYLVLVLSTPFLLVIREHGITFRTIGPIFFLFPRTYFRGEQVADFSELPVLEYTTVITGACAVLKEK